MLEKAFIMIYASQGVIINWTDDAKAERNPWPASKRKHLQGAATRRRPSINVDCHAESTFRGGRAPSSAGCGPMLEILLISYRNMSGWLLVQLPRGAPGKNGRIRTRTACEVQCSNQASNCRIGKSWGAGYQNQSPCASRCVTWPGPSPVQFSSREPSSSTTHATNHG